LGLELEPCLVEARALALHLRQLVQASAERVFQPADLDAACGDAVIEARQLTLRPLQVGRGRRLRLSRDVQLRGEHFDAAHGAVEALAQARCLAVTLAERALQRNGASELAAELRFGRGARRALVLELAARALQALGARGAVALQLDDALGR